jgi:hypothetical protein
MRDHWDMEGNLPGDSQRFKFEVKGLKRFNRRFEEDRGLAVQDEMMLIEWRNVNGNIGWILGASDRIAQKRKKYAWLIVPTKPLWEMVKSKLNQEDINAKATEPWSFKKPLSSPSPKRHDYPSTDQGPGLPEEVESQGR